MALLARIILSPANYGSTMRISVYPGPYTRNLSPLVNFIYQIRSDILFSTEYRYLNSTVLDSGSFKCQSRQSEPWVYFLVRYLEPDAANLRSSLSLCFGACALLAQTGLAARHRSRWKS